MNIYKDLFERGLINDVTHKEIDEHLNTGKRTVYCGFDPTADSLHVGSLVPLMVLRRFQNFGHTAIVLVGGATGLIGDPAGKKEERKLLDDSIVGTWKDKLIKQIEKFVIIDDKVGIAVDNYDWIKNTSTIEFLRDAGKHFSINKMLTNTSVKSRLNREGEGLSYTEFSYTLLQSIDAVELKKKYDCTIQIGGSDQWGNILNGIELGRKTGVKPMYGLTLPLVTKSDGQKFGKSESGSIWLDKKKTSTYTFYQFWLNTSDDDVESFLKFFTFLELENINNIMTEHNQSPEKRYAQKILAREITDFIHGEEARIISENISLSLFSNDFSKLTLIELEELSNSSLEKYTINSDDALIDTLIKFSAISSKTAARNLINSGAIYINGVKVTDDLSTKSLFSKENRLYNKFLIIRKGKKDYYLITVNN
jgi:tyrosyl-tRNA synthetase